MLGNHGYDPAEPAMQHPLLACGPAFRRSFLHTTLLENVDVFELLLLTLELDEAPVTSNGSRLRVRPLLAPVSLGFWIRSNGAVFWTACEWPGCAGWCGG